ncbi:MAG: hypothetical protein EA350_14485 [Gemmatimonadales bacterium]|nr:MAG: hypothetical protein EA350_14485 [Gemmatimonadales bacterium]
MSDSIPDIALDRASAPTPTTSGGRRFDDEEVAEILARATQPDRADHADGGADHRLPGDAGGTTLAELQSIGAEVGIAPERIASAAREIQLRAATPPPQRFLGAPRSVSHIVPLPGPLDDAQWDRLVAHLRSTFAAQGKVSQSGAIRSWRNGNLQAHVEPDPDAHPGAHPDAAAGTGAVGATGRAWRLRMQTLKGSASPGGNFGIFAVLFGLVMMVLYVLGGAGTQGLLVGAGFTLAGVLNLGYLRATLPDWAQTRKAQMEQIAAGVRHQLEP